MRNVNGGFTLIEVMVVVAITVIVMAIGIPGMQELMESSRVRNAGNEILSNLLYARSEAVNLGVEITVCPLNSSNACVDDWSLGLNIFIDSNNNQILESTEKRIKAATPFAGNDTLEFNNGSWINFTPDGLTSKNGNFSYCTTTQDPIGIVLATSGRARIDNSIATCS